MKTRKATLNSLVCAYKLRQMLLRSEVKRRVQMAKFPDFQLSPGYNTAMSGIGVYYPNKQEAQRVGVIIDVPTTRTIHGVVSDRDEIL